MSSVAEKPSQVLREALKLMDGGKKWGRGAYNRNGAFCSIGALSEVSPDAFDFFSPTRAMLKRAVGFDSAVDWNDAAPDFSVIEQGFQKAIALAESEGK